MNTSIRRLTTFCLFVFLMMSPSHLFANAVGTDQQTFHPSHNGKSFVTVNSGDTLNQFELHLGVFANYALNSLVYFTNTNEIAQSRGEINDRIGTVDLILDLGIIDWWDIGINIPFVFDQDVKDDSRRIQYLDKGNTEVRVATKVRLINQSCLLYTSPSPRDQRGSRMPSSA